MTRLEPSPLHIEWTPGWVRMVDITTSACSEAPRLSELRPVMNGHRQALVGIGRSRVFLKAMRLPRAAPDDLRRILGVQMAQMFPLPSEQLAFDFVQTADQTAEGCMTVIGAVRADDLRELREALREIGLTASRILPVALGAPVAAARAGSPRALLAERHPNGLMLDVVDCGVLRFSRVAAEDSDPEIEARKTLAASRTVDAPVLMVGNGTFPGTTPAAHGALDFLHEAPPFHLTLAEDRYREARRRSNARIRLAVLMLTSALLLMTMVWLDRQTSLALVTRGQGAWAREFVLDQSILNAASDDADQAGSVRDHLRQALQPAQPLSDISAVIAADVPPGAWLTGMSLERGKLLQVRGTAKTSSDVARLMDTLTASARFRDVRLVFANSAAVGKVPVVQFNISAVCVGNNPLPTAPKADTDTDGEGGA